MNGIELPQGTIRYRDTGTGEQTIVLLHGLLVGGDLWSAVVPHLEGEFRIPVPDGDRNAVITWSCGDNVSSLEISGLSTPQFSEAGSGGFVSFFSVTDLNDDTTEYPYFVSATQVSTGQVARHHDPKIRNGAG